MYDIIELNKKLVNDLREIAKGLEIKKTDKLKKEDFVRFATEIPSFNYYLKQLMKDRTELASIINMPVPLPTK